MNSLVNRGNPEPVRAILGYLKSAFPTGPPVLVGEEVDELVVETDCTELVDVAEGVNIPEVLAPRPLSMCVRG